MLFTGSCYTHLFSGGFSVFFFFFFREALFLILGLAAANVLDHSSGFSAFSELLLPLNGSCIESSFQNPLRLPLPFFNSCSQDLQN